MYKFLFCLISLSLCLCACNEYTPRPLGYPRIEHEEVEYEEFENELIAFRYPSDAIIQNLKHNKDGKEFWFNISYPQYEATLHCSYLRVTPNTYKKAEEDCYLLAYSHASKAEEIFQSKIENDSIKFKSGIIYEIKGEVASPIQFYVTDQKINFLRASLYYDRTMNSDSIAPVTQILHKDVLYLLNSLEWKNK